MMLMMKFAQLGIGRNRLSAHSLVVAVVDVLLKKNHARLRAAIRASVDISLGHAVFTMPIVDFRHRSYSSAASAALKDLCCR